MKTKSWYGSYLLPRFFFVVTNLKKKKKEENKKKITIFCLDVT